MLVNQFDSSGNVTSRAISLHAGGREKHVNRARATRDDVKDISNGSAGSGGNDAHASGENRQRTLELLRTQSFPLKAIPQLLKCNLQRTGANWVKCLHDQFILAARFIYCKTAPGPDVQSIFRSEAYATVCRTEAFGAKLSAFIFNREIPMTGRMRFKIRDFAFDPNR